MFLFITHCENKCREFMDFFKKQDVLIGKEVLGNKCDFFKNVASTGRNHHFYRTTHNVRSQYVTVGDQNSLGDFDSYPGTHSSYSNCNRTSIVPYIMSYNLLISALANQACGRITGVTRWLLYANVLKENLNCKEIYVMLRISNYQ